MAMQIVIGTVAGFGALCIFWSLFGWMFGSADLGQIYLSSIPEDSLLLRMKVLRNFGILRGQICCPGDRLNEQERVRLEAYGVKIYSPTDLYRWLEREVDLIDTDGAGDHTGRHQFGGLSEL